MSDLLTSAERDIARETDVIFVSDIHLRHKRPICRAEPDWYDVMKRDLWWLRAFADEGRTPIVCAGDVFDRWDSPPELVNFAFSHLPKMYTIPGQHDLPFHRYKDKHKSAYHTLCMARRLHDIERPMVIGDIALYPFWWGKELTPLKPIPGAKFHVAVVHRYVYQRGKGHPGAMPEHEVAVTSQVLNGYDLCVFGDNHQQFYDQRSRVLNCGGFFCTTKAEQSRHPAIWCLMKDGSITCVSNPFARLDQFLFKEEELAKNARDESLSRFVQDLRVFDMEDMNFKGAIVAALRSATVKDAVKAIVLEIMEGAK